MKRLPSINTMIALISVMPPFWIRGPSRVMPALGLAT